MKQCRSCGHLIGSGSGRYAEGDTPESVPKAECPRCTPKGATMLAELETLRKLAVVLRRYLSAERAFDEDASERFSDPVLVWGSRSDVLTLLQDYETRFKKGS